MAGRPAGDADARWRQTRADLLRLGNSLGTASADQILRLVVDALRAATGSDEAVVFLRNGTRLVARARAGTGEPSSVLAAVAEAVIASGARAAEQTAAGVAVVAPLVVANGTAGALAVRQAATSAIPVEETAERVDLFAALAGAALRTEGALARQRDAALGAIHRLVARTAHELNNPLGGVKLYGRLIEQRLAKAGDTYGEGLAQKVGNAVDRLTTLIAELAERGRPTDTTAAQVPVNALLSEAIAALQSRAAAVPVEIATDLGGSIGNATGDAQDMRRVFRHLLSNALDATPPDGRITVKSHRPEPGTIEVVVEDSGGGMDVDTATQALGLFFTNRQHAAGLGLAIVQAAVEACGGSLTVQSEPGRGTRAAVRLPAAGG